MSSKSTTEKKSFKSVNVEDFDIAKFSIAPIEDFKTESTQKIAFPRYDNERCIIRTKPIQILCGGIPKTDATNDPKKKSYRPTNSHCLYLWLNLDQDENGRELLNKLEEIDSLLNREINEKKNKNYIVNKKQEPYLPGKIIYKNLVKDCDPSANEDDEDKKKLILEKSKIYKRIKVVIPTEYQEASSKDAEPTNFKVEVYENDEDGKPIKEQVKIKSLDDLREKLAWTATVQFGLEINKFWIMKSGDKFCGLTVKMLVVYITHKPTQVLSTKTMGFDFFGIGGSTTDDAVKLEDVKKEVKKDDKKDKKDDKKDSKKDVKVDDKKKKKDESSESSESESDPSSDSSSESESSDSSDSSESSESDKKKKTTKKNK